MINSLPAIPKAVASIQRGELSPVELVEYCLSRIDAWESRVRAWVFVDEMGARREANRLAELARSGTILGPLHGIPLGVKDIIDVAGWPTKAGSRVRENHVAARDAELITRLRRAGAIILGKTVTTEFASFDPPPTRNPWNVAHTPGGSSSGSAAAVSLEMCAAAIGSQTGGSITRPASYCGVAGLKPTYHAVSLDGIVPLSANMDHAGPIARNVADLAAVYGVIRRIDGPEIRPTRIDQGKSSSRSARLPRLSWLKGFFWERAESEVRRVFEKAVRQLGDLVEDRDWPGMPASFASVPANHRMVMAVDAAEYHRESFQQQRDMYGPQIGKLIDEGLATGAVDYAHALRHQKEFSTEFQNALAATIAITPSTTTTAPGIETTGDPAFNSPWSFAGVPTITIPCGLDRSGLPCGLQLISVKLDEANLLAVAARCEELIGFDAKPKWVLSTEY